jgi:hypothetical protein
MTEKGHKAGGVHAFYRTVRVFLRWYAAEFEPEGWRDPLKKGTPAKGGHRTARTRAA